MSTNPTRVLKGALWIQAALLLVLTSILADSNAWVGAIMTGLGLVLVVIGIAAAHKRRTGYLYCYATLVGLWEILALTHILVICGLIALPPTLVSPAYVVGQKVVENPADSMKVVMPLLYGLQWGGWCITLVCLASLRLTTRDAAVAFEIQQPKQPHSLEAGHSQISHGGSPRMNQHLFNFRQSVISPMGGAFVGAGTTTYGEGDGFSSAPRSRNSGEGSSRPRMSKGKDIIAGYSNDIDNIQAPERAWIGKERRVSSDTSTIYIPNDRRISQVVVTFRDDVNGGDQLTQQRSVYSSQSLPSPIAGPSRSQKPDATTIYIASHNHSAMATGGDALNGSNVRGAGDVYKINFSTPGESLSDMIFKPPQNGVQPSLPPKSTPTLGSPPHVEHVAAVQERLGLQDHPKADMPNPARIRGTATKASLTLSSDSSSSELSALSGISNSDDEGPEKEHVSADGHLKTVSEGSTVLGQENVIAGLAMVSVTPLKIMPKVNIQNEGDVAENTDQDATKSVKKPIQTQQHGTRMSPVIEEGVVGEEHPSTSSPCDGADGSSEFRPQAQPNSSDSSPSLSSLSSSSSRREGRCEVGVHRDYAEDESAFSKGLDNSWLPDQASASSTISSPASFSSSSVIAIASSGPVSMTPSAPEISLPIVLPFVSTTTTSTSGPRPRSNISLPLQYWRNRQSSSSPLSHKAEPSVSSTPSFSPNYIASTFSKKKKPIIPTIVIHPDEEDGEPPRVLSQKDIEYLSTMPPPPLRTLVQPWDDISEEDEYDDEMINEGRGHDDYHHQHHDYDNRRRSYDYDLESDEDYEVELDRMEGIDRNDIRAESFDPNALDVSIDLDVNLRELACVDEVESRPVQSISV